MQLSSSAPLTLLLFTAFLSLHLFVDVGEAVNVGEEVYSYTFVSRHGYDKDSFKTFTELDMSNAVTMHQTLCGSNVGGLSVEDLRFNNKYVSVKDDTVLYSFKGATQQSANEYKEALPRKDQKALVVKCSLVNEHRRNRDSLIPCQWDEPKILQEVIQGGKEVEILEDENESTYKYLVMYQLEQPCPDDSKYPDSEDPINRVTYQFWYQYPDTCARNPGLARLKFGL